jgi:kinesin family protein 4/21/27
MRVKRVSFELLTSIWQRNPADNVDSKLRAHLEDARQDNRRISDENRDFLSELNERRSQLTKIDEVKRAERESLLAANQQVAKLKAQLQQASDGKVSKKTGGLKVSFDSLYDKGP